MKLLIFTRQGCCICDALKKNIERIKITDIYSSLEIEEIDIDRYDLYKDQYKKYDHEVPIVGLKISSSNQFFELPRISPRLKDEQLTNWLKAKISKIIINL